MAGKIKTLFEAAEKLEKGASRRVGALGNKGVRIEPGSKVGSAVGGIKDTKTGRVLKKDKIKDLTSTGRRRIAGTAAAGAAASTLSGGSDDKPKKKDFTKGVSRGGVPFKEAFSKARKDGKKTFEWNNKKYTTELASEKKKESKPKATTAKKKQGAIFGKDAKFRPFGGVLARALLGDDEKFGGERGLIDFVRTKKKPDKKAKGGEMMKAKGYHNGGVAAKTSAKKTSRRPAPREEKLAAGRRAPARGGVKRRPTRPPQPVRQMPEMSGVKRRPSRPMPRMPEMSEVKRRPTRPMPRMPEMSGVKRRPTRPMPRMSQASQAPQMGGVKARPTRSQMSSASPSRPTRQMPQTGGVKRRPPSMPRFGGRRMPMMQSGGMAMKSKMASKGGKMGGKMAPGYKNGGSVGKKKARGVGAAKRGFGRAMR